MQGQPESNTHATEDREEPEEKDEKIQSGLAALVYKKIVYHCLRYPSSKVYGVLVGPNQRQITDAFPLFHSGLVQPTLSVALDLIEGNLRSGDKIVGLYQFVENSEPVFAKLREVNASLRPLMAVRVWVDEEENLRLAAKGFRFTHPNFGQLKQELKGGQHWLIVDMDSHFEDPALDFRNLYVS